MLIDNIFLAKKQPFPWFNPKFYFCGFRYSAALAGVV